MATFELHPRLLADCHVFGRFGPCHLLLQRNALLPWYILVPEVPVTELHLVQQPLRNRIRDAVDALAALIKSHHACPHTNVAAIGNMVPQLHIHVIGRHPEDPCWPGVVWGNLPDGPEWSHDALAAIRRTLSNEGFMEADQ